MAYNTYIKDATLGDLEDLINRCLGSNSGGFGGGGRSGNGGGSGSGGGGGGASPANTPFGELAKGIKDLNQRLMTFVRKMDQAYRQLDSLVGAWEKTEFNASQFSKALGQSKESMDAMARATAKNINQNKIGIDFNMGADELIKAQQSYSEGIGRNIRVDNDSQVDLAAMNALMGDSWTAMATKMENFGLGLTDAGKHAGKLFKEASESGLAFKEYSQMVSDNLEMAQNYTFANGIKGLEAMAKKALAIKMDMRQVQALADKAGDVSGAIEASAKLQVLGGPFAQISDPLGMLNESLNDVGGLMDRIGSMTASMGTFNKDTGQVEVSGFNRKRLKAVAEATGMDYSEIMKSVNAQAKRSEIDVQLGQTKGANSFSEEMKELIRNTAEFKNGQAGVTIDGQFKALSELSNKDYGKLVAETQGQAEDVKDIARMLRSYTDTKQGRQKMKESHDVRTTQWLGQGLKSITNWLGNQNWLMSISSVIKLINGIGAATKTAGEGFAALKPHSEGGIIDGDFTQGDKEIVRANAGEMILNTTQQSNLFDIIKGKPTLSSEARPSNGNVTPTDGDMVLSPAQQKTLFNIANEENNTSISTSSSNDKKISTSDEGNVYNGNVYYGDVNEIVSEMGTKSSSGANKDKIGPSEIKIGVDTVGVSTSSIGVGTATSKSVGIAATNGGNNIVTNPNAGNEVSIAPSKGEDGANKEKIISREDSSSSTSSKPASNGPVEGNINVVFSGDLKLKGKDGKYADIGNDLLKDPSFISDITEMIRKEFIKMKKGTVLKERA